MRCLRSEPKEEYDAQNLEVMFLHVHQGYAFLTNRYEFEHHLNWCKRVRILEFIQDRRRIRSSSNHNNCPTDTTDSSTKLDTVLNYSKHYQAFIETSESYLFND